MRVVLRLFVCAWLVGVAVVPCAAQEAQEAPPAAATSLETTASRQAASRVRLLAPQARQLVRIGRLRSPTFARLLEEVERSSVIVLVEIAATGEGGGRAGALHFLTTGGSDTRILRVRLYPQTSTWLASIAQHVTLTAALGHELQHALEVHARASVRTAEDFATMYRAEGTRVRFKQGEEFETTAALHIGRQVERELLGAPTAAPLQPCAAL